MLIFVHRSIESPYPSEAEQYCLLYAFGVPNPILLIILISMKSFDLTHVSFSCHFST